MYGSVILRATLKPEGSSQGVFPAGGIDFYDGDALLGHGSSTYDPGVFTFATPAADQAEALAPGDHNIRAVYPGDAYYTGVASPAQGFKLTVLPKTQAQGRPTTTTVTAMVNDSSPRPAADCWTAITPSFWAGRRTRRGGRFTWRDC